jgi:hypothetical protein
MKKNKALKAKGISFGYQNIAAIWIIVWSVRKFLSESPTIREIIVSGLAIAACFTPVYFNLIMDKFVGNTNNNNNEENECVREN